MKRILENALSLIGLFLIAVYVINATEIISLPVEFVRIPMFLLGPIAIIGVTSLEKITDQKRNLLKFKLLDIIF